MRGAAVVGSYLKNRIQRPIELDLLRRIGVDDGEDKMKVGEPVVHGYDVNGRKTQVYILACGFR